MAEIQLQGALVVGPRQLQLALSSRAEALAIVGPSGAGKSTILRVIAGVERRPGLALRVGGALWQGPDRFLPPWERRVGWVPQDGLLFPHLSVRENLAYAARIDVEPIARMLGVDGLLDRMPRRLSGGERQRVALGRALASDPRLLLLDEPFSALDRPRRATLGQAVATWARGRGTPLILVSHDAEDLALIASEVWEISDDALVQR